MAKHYGGVTATHLLSKQLRKRYKVTLLTCSFVRFARTLKKTRNQTRNQNDHPTFEMQRPTLPSNLIP
jgi:hypothetical protein